VRPRRKRDPKSNPSDRSVNQGMRYASACIRTIGYTPSREPRVGANPLAGGEPASGRGGRTVRDLPEARGAVTAGGFALCLKTFPLSAHVTRGSAPGRPRCVAVVTDQWFGENGGCRRDDVRSSRQTTREPRRKRSATAGRRVPPSPSPEQVDGVAHVAPPPPPPTNGGTEPGLVVGGENDMSTSDADRQLRRGLADIARTYARRRGCRVVGVGVRGS